MKFCGGCPALLLIKSPPTESFVNSIVVSLLIVVKLKTLHQSSPLLLGRMLLMLHAMQSCWIWLLSCAPCIRLPFGDECYFVTSFSNSFPPCVSFSGESCLLCRLLCVLSYFQKVTARNKAHSHPVTRLTLLPYSQGRKTREDALFPFLVCPSAVTGGGTLRRGQRCWSPQGRIRFPPSQGHVLRRGILQW